MRTNTIKNLFQGLDFISVILKYDYFVESKLDFIISNNEKVDLGYQCHIVPLKDDRIVINLPYKNHLDFWNLKTQKCDTIISDGKIDTEILGFLEDGKMVVGIKYQSINIWDPITQKYIQSLKDDYITIFIDKNIIAISYYNHIKIWNITTDNTDITIKLAMPIFNLILIRNKIIGIAVTKIKICDINTGELKFTLVGHLNHISDIKKLSKNLIVTSSYDKTLRI